MRNLYSNSGVTSLKMNKTMSSYVSSFGKFAILFFLLTSASSLYSQCAWYNANTACTSDAPTVVGTSISCTPVANDAGRRNFVVNNMTAGCTYRISNCGSGFDTQLTIRNSAGTVVGYIDDNGPACSGTAASLDFNCTTSGQYWIQLNRFNCNSSTNQVNGSITVSLQDCAPLQNIVPASGNNSYTLCSGILYDHGGSAGNYSPNVNGFTEINPATAGNMVQVSGSIAGENCCDFLRIYDGTGLSGTLLWSGIAGTGTVPTITSTSGPLTVQFTSDASVQGAGFALNISCVAPVASAPSCASSPTAPGNGSSGISVGTTLSWPAVANASGYDVYFGTSSNPSLVSTNQTGTTYNPGTLNPSSLYYWRIVPRNGSGFATGCATWSFTTGFAGCTGGVSYTNYTPICSGSHEYYAGCTFAGEYNTLSLTASTSYTFGSSVTTDYITILTNTGIIITAGNQPLNFTPTSSGQYRILVNTNSTCGTASSCRDPWVQCAPPPCNGTSVTLNMTDTWGDGWNGAQFYIQESGGTIYGPFTLGSGSSGTQSICLPNGCYRVILSEGSFPYEIGWSLTNGATTFASATAPNAAPFNTLFTIGGASCPAEPSNNLCVNAPIIDLGVNSNQTQTGTGIGSTNTLGLTQFSQTWVRIVVPCGGMNVSMNFCNNSQVISNAYINLFSTCGPDPGLTQAANWNLTNCANGSITLNWNNVPAGTYYYPILIDNIAWPGAYSVNISGTSLHSPATAPTSISSTNTVCPGQSTTLTLQGGSPGTDGVAQWFTGSCGSTLIGTSNSITVSPTVNTTYFVRYSGSCNTTICANVDVNVSSYGVDGSLSADLTTVCHGQSVTVTPSGGVGTPRYWISSNGGISWDVLENVAANAPGNSYNFIPPASGGTFLIHARWQTACGFCWDQSGGMANCTTFQSTTITINPAGTALAGNESATCLVNSSNWIRFYGSTGNLIAEVNPNGREGLLTVQSFTGSVGSMFDCNLPNAEEFRTAFMGRNYIVSTTGLTGTGNVDVRFPFSDAELIALSSAAGTIDAPTGGSLTSANPNDNVSTAANIGFTKYSNPGFEDGNPLNNCTGGILSFLPQTGNGVLTGAPYNIPNSQFVQVSTPSFSEFFLHGSGALSPLPVSLISFSADCNSNAVQLNWSTASELNADRFIIERSREMNQWIAIRELSAGGNSNQIINYTFTDTDPISGTSYYRLRQVDFDGEEELFGPISVDCEYSSTAIKVYPNPTIGAFTLEINSLTEVKNTTVQLTDVMGKVIASKVIDIVAGTNHIYFQEKFETGTYLIRVLHATNEFETVKVIINH